MAEICPVCRARYRGVAECGRCGAALEKLMELEVASWRLRQQARGHLPSHPQAALRCAQEAQELQWTPQGRDLELLARLYVVEASTRMP